MNLSSLNPFARKTSSVAVQPPAAPTPATSKGKKAMQFASAGPGLIERLWTSWLNRPRAVPAASVPAAVSSAAPAPDHFEAIRNQIDAFERRRKVRWSA